MTPEEQKICALEIKIAALDQKSKDDDKALVLAKNATNAIWAAVLALILGLTNLAIQLRK